MGTIITSNEVAGRTLGSLLLELLPQNGISGFFDFSNGDYEIRDTRVPLSDFLAVTRSSPAQGYNRAGELVNYAVNTPRFHFVKNAGIYGLAIGDTMRNYFKNANAPVSQSVTFAEGTDVRFFTLVTVEGPVGAKVNVSGAGVEPFTVEAGAHKIIKTVTNNNTLQVDVVGAPTFVQVSRVSSPYGVDPSRPVTAGGAYTKVQDVPTLNVSKIAEMFTGNDATMFFKFTKFDGGDNALTPHTANTIEIFSGAGVAALGGYVSWLKMLNGTTGELSIRKQQSGSVLESSPVVAVPVEKTNIVAAVLGPTKASIYMNGVFSKMAGSNAVAVEPWPFRLPALLALNGNYMAPNYVMDKMVVYDRQLSDAEVKTVADLLR